MRSQRTHLLLVPVILALLALLYVSTEPDRPGRGRGRPTAASRTADRPGPGARGGAETAAATGPATVWSGVTEGIVRDPEGNPVRGAKVIVRTPHVTMSALSDAQGRYRLDGLSVGQGRIEIRAPHHVDVEPQSLMIGSIAGPPLEFALLQGQTVAGRVLDARGGGVAGARVRVDGESLKVSVTSGAGEYEISGLAPGDVTLIASAAEYPAVEARVSVVAGRQNYCDITVHRGAAVTGRVADAAGQPVVGALINVMGRIHDWVESGERGEFTLYGVPVDSEASIVATHHDYLAASSDGLRLRPGELFAGLELVMQRGGRVQGQVVTAEQQPADRVHVGLRVIEAKSAGGPLEATTDSQGAFRISPVPPGRYSVVVRDGAATATPEVQLEPGAVVEGVVLELTAALPIAGRVQDAAGTPVPGAIVDALGANARAVSDEQGGFVLPGLAEGRYQIRARLPIGGGVVTSERVAAGADDIVLELPVPGALAGSVADAEGAPATSFELQIRAPDGEVFRIPEASADGAFRVDGVAPGKYEVLARTAQGRSAALTPVVVEPGRETGGLKLQVAAGETVWGRVLFKDGAPAQGVAVVAQPAAGQKNAPERATTTNGDGSFSVDGLVAGVYRLALSYEGVTEFSEPVQLPIHAGLSLALPRATTLTIRVTDPAGNPVAGARVSLDNKYGAVPVRPAVSLDRFPPDQRAAKEAELIARARVTDDAGVCARRGVPEGTVTVTVAAEGYRGALLKTEVDPTGLSEVTVVLQPAQP